MLVTFVSQCKKKAIKRTRRILDAFANRIGDNVWQTAITEDGLQTVKKLLNASASKSTAVSCHLVCSRRRTKLVWVVGNQRQFNEQGFVAVNTTKCNILHSDWENNWTALTAIGIVATLAALLHDIGKSSNGFQHKLFHPNKGDPYRHEWLSLKLWLWLLQGCQTDKDVWQRLQTIDAYLAQQTPSTQDLQNGIDKGDMGKLPPVAQWIGWLIVTHHRLPPLKACYFSPQEKQKLLEVGDRYFLVDLNLYYQKAVKAIPYWVKNPKSLDERNNKQFFCFDALVWHSPDWQKQLKRYANKAAKDPMLAKFAQSQTAIANPFLLMLSRLSLMVGDHNYSALQKDDKTARVKGSQGWQDKLIANTDDKTRQANQALDEHLLGVARLTGQFCKQLPILHKKLPTLVNHDPLAKNTANGLFAWQNNAFKLARNHSKSAQTHGFFGVNMASTGTGKTIANARIMYGIACPNKGARFSIALGLRVLTLQTGQSFRQNLALDDRQLAILVGGISKPKIAGQEDSPLSDFGSESAETLVDEWIDGGGYGLDELNLGVVIQSDTAKKLLGSPVVVCTIDHLMQASEGKRGGKYIVPLLRLFSGDLIIDEPDDFDQNDMPALSRLVHLAGVFGARVLLSSATLPPDMVAGLFLAYLAGRKIYNGQFGDVAPEVVCAWFDEHRTISHQCQDGEQFTKAHHKFVHKRCQFLDNAPTHKMASVLPITAHYHSEKEGEFYQTLAYQLLGYAHDFHQNHHIKANDKKISVGLIRMANIQPLMSLATAIHQLQDFAGQDNTQFYVCAYHSQQVLALRGRLEHRLDTLLNRKNADDLTTRPAITDAIDKHPNKTHHIFIVLATAVAEVGRDHDYDWAMVEPSSMRSIIQLAGRVWRHRPEKIAQSPNIGIWQYNIQALKNPNQDIVFTRPGFESQNHRLGSHDINDLIPKNTLQKLTAKSRIKKSDPLCPSGNLADLEHQVMADLMNNERPNVVNAYFQDTQTANRSHTHLTSLTPFRAGRANVDYIIKPRDDGIDAYNAQSVKQYGLANSKTQSKVIECVSLPTNSPFVDVWLADRLTDVLATLEHRLAMNPNTVIRRFSVVALAEQTNGYYFDERFGFWRK